MPRPSRPHRDLLRRLRYEDRGVFPPYALDEVRRVQLALKSGAAGEQLGTTLEDEGFVLPEGGLDDYIRRRGRPMAFVLNYYHELLDELWRGANDGTTEGILRFLERNPFTFRSGYSKVEQIRRLAKRPLSAHDRSRVEEILREVVLDGWRVSMPGWPRLLALCAPEAVEAIVREALASPRQDVVRKGALLMLLHRGKTQFYGALKGHGTGHRPEWTAVIRWARDEIAGAASGEGPNQEPSQP